MRDLLDEEVVKALDDNGEADDGFIAVESDFEELDKYGASIVCGVSGNQPFAGLQRHFGNRKVRCWYNSDTKEIMGMVHIEGREEEGEDIEDIAGKEGVTLRYDRESAWDGFLEFENE